MHPLPGASLSLPARSSHSREDTGSNDGERDSTGSVTSLLEAWQCGDRRAGDALLPIVYEELRKIARGYLSIERPGHTLQPTALVHEAYLRLVDQKNIPWRGRSHFFAIAAKVIRRILVDHARRHRAAKRGGGGPRVPLSEIADLAVERPEQLVELDLALRRLKKIDSLKAEIVEYRFFGGLNDKETAEVLGSSATTVYRQWRMARAWLYRALSPPAAATGS